MVQPVPTLKAVYILAFNQFWAGRIIVAIQTACGTWLERMVLRCNLNFSTFSRREVIIFNRERSSTGSNDCFVVLVVLVFYPLVI
jgi:hypothetical protein